MGNSSDDSRVFTSTSISSQELLQRARARLRAAGAAPAPAAAPGEIDLERGTNLVDGWYAVERYDGEPVRWAARRFDFTAEVGAATHVEMEVLLPEESGMSELRARLSVNDRAGDAFRIHQGWNRLLVGIPAGISGPAHFSVEAGDAWSPLDRSVNDDGRELSVCVRRLALVRPDVTHTFDGEAPSTAPRAPAVQRFDHLDEASLPSRFSPQRVRALARIPELEFRIARSEARLAVIEPRLADVDARLSTLESRVQRLESAVTQLVTLLEKRLAAIEGAHRELRADLGPRADAPPPTKR